MQFAIAALACLALLALAGCAGKPGETKVTDASKLKDKHYEITCHFTTDGKDGGQHAAFTSCTGGALKDGRLAAAEVTYAGMDDSTDGHAASLAGSRVGTTVYYPTPGGNSEPSYSAYVVDKAGAGAFDVEVHFPVDPQGLGAYVVDVEAFQNDVSSGWTTFWMPQMKDLAPVSHREEVNLTTGALF
ncbi:MAG: hypothetical protein V4510_09030 [bacterium]